MWIIVCALGVLVSLGGEYRSNLAVGATGKLVAASAYIAFAWSLGAMDSGYGRILLVGMVFCWIGDLLLISNNNRKLFLLGLASFLLGHIAYIGAFAVHGVSHEAVILGILAMAVFSWFVFRWLKPGLDDRMRKPVLFYILAISLMMAMAIGAFAIDGNRAIPLGALMFLVSDLSVARDRFIAPGFVNRAWGLPLYFCAQMTLASSVML